MCTDQFPKFLPRRNKLINQSFLWPNALLTSFFWLLTNCIQGWKFLRSPARSTWRQWGCCALPRTCSWRINTIIIGILIFIIIVNFGYCALPRTCSWRVKNYQQDQHHHHRHPHLHHHRQLWILCSASYLKLAGDHLLRSAGFREYWIAHYWCKLQWG